VVVVDYLQIMGGLDANNLTNSLAEVTSNFKALAKELDCPVILLSQLNRELEKRPNKRPINSDLRSSGSIEQDADIIIFVYRDEVYNENSEHKGIAEIIIGKNRHGEIGTVRLRFDGARSKFTDINDFTPQYDEDGHPFHA
jgi:replicative DNA helicase